MSLSGYTRELLIYQFLFWFFSPFFAFVRSTTGISLTQDIVLQFDILIQNNFQKYDRISPRSALWAQLKNLHLLNIKIPKIVQIHNYNNLDAENKWVHKMKCWQMLFEKDVLKGLQRCFTKQLPQAGECLLLCNAKRGSQFYLFLFFVVLFANKRIFMQMNILHAAIQMW